MARAYSFETMLRGILFSCANISCGQDIYPFWLNTDIQPSNPTVAKLDLKSDDDLIWLSSKRFDRVYLSHVVGYLNVAQLDMLLQSIHGSLKPNGSLVIEFPDALKISRSIVQMHDSAVGMHEYVESIRGFYAFDAHQAFDQSFHGQTYIFSWSSKMLMQHLIKNNFSRVIEQLPRSHGMQHLRDSRLKAFK